MNNPIFTLEISNTNVKLVVGYVLDGVSVVLYASNVEIPRPNYSVELVNDSEISEAIKTLVAEVKQNMNLDVKNVVLSLPSLDLDVLIVNNQTALLSTVVTVVDVQNLYNLLRRTKISDHKTIISIVPEAFTIGDGKFYSYVPFNAVSNVLAVKGYLHILPKVIHQSYLSAVENAGVSVLKTFADTFALKKLFDSTTNSTYFLLNYDENYTTISFVGQNILFQTKLIHLGSNHLTSEISSSLNISLEQAKRLQNVYGLERSNNPINLPLLKRSDGSEVTYKQLNEVITNHLLKWTRQVKDTISVISHNQNLSQNGIGYDIITTGVGTKLNGFEELCKTQISEYKLRITSITTIGARDNKFAVTLGLIKAYHSYNQEIGDERTTVGPLTKG